MTALSEQFTPITPTPPVETAAGHEHPYASYNQYRLVCDADTDGFRKVGIQDPEAYHAALADPKSVLSVVNDSYMPLLTPIGYEDRYQADRCQEMTGAEDVMLFALPLSRVYEGQVRPDNLFGGQALSDNFAIVVEEIDSGARHENREDEHGYVASLMHGLGNLVAGEFVHPRLERHPDNRTAWMGIFSFSFQPTEQNTALSELPPQEAFERAWSDYCDEKGQLPLPNKIAEGTYLLTSQQLREHPEILEALWGISEIGFGKILGANHPMSMEVTREFFDQELLAEGIYTTVHYHEGKPVCFGSLALDMDHNDWLDCTSTTLRTDMESAKSRGETLGHFFELISNGPKGLSFSPYVIGLLADLSGRTGRPYRMYFESTNLSARYIPRIVRGQVTASPNVELIQDVEMLSRVHYWYLKPQPGVDLQ